MHLSQNNPIYQGTNATQIGFCFNALLILLFFIEKKNQPFIVNDGTLLTKKNKKANKQTNKKKQN